MENLMSQVAPDLPDDVQRKIDDHLDAVERVLLRENVSRLERRNILDEVETQIHEMLAAHGGEDRAAAVMEILSRLDPPEAYASERASVSLPPPAATGTTRSFTPRELWRRWREWWSVQPDRPRVSPPALVGAIWAGLLVLLLVALLPMHRPPPFLLLLLALVGPTAPLGVTILGFLAVRRIRRPGSNEFGLPLALVETFFFPTLLANLALIGVLAASREAGLILLAALVIIVANVGLARYAWRRFGHRFLKSVDALSRKT
jgi:hypothetical protein